MRGQNLGRVSGAETGFILRRNPDTVRAPDIAFVTLERHLAARTEGFFSGAPDLVVEVVSPGDTIYEVDAKVDDWLAAGARLVWVVTPRRRAVTVHRAGGRVTVLTENEELTGEDVVPGFVCRVLDIFI